jgi:hypothetical protein
LIFPETEKATDRKTAENRTRICRREDMKTSTIFLLLVSRLRRDASAQSEMNNHDPNQEQQQVLGRRALGISKPGLTRHPCPIYGSKFRKTLHYVTLQSEILTFRDPTAQVAASPQLEKLPDKK